MSWTSLVARTRGLSAHLLSEGALRSIESCATSRELAVRLAEWKYLARAGGDAVAGPRQIELACRRVAADRLAVLERWAREDRALLLPFTLGEDLRSVRALVRGAIAGIAADDRLAGLIPTRLLPLRALSHLASIRDIAAMRAVLAAWRHPLAGALESSVAGFHTDLLVVDCRLLDAWARASLRAGRRLRARSIADYVAQTIDLANANTARILASQRAERPDVELFVPGGRFVSRDAFVRTAARRDVGELVGRVRAQSPGSAIDIALSSESARVEEEVLLARIREARERTRQDPLDPGVIALFLLRLRAEHARIIRAAWSGALGVLPRVSGVAPSRTAAA